MNGDPLPDETLFERLMTCRDRAERQALLEEACGGDAGRRRGIEALLEAHEQAGQFMEPLAGHGRPAPPEHRNPTESAGSVIGRYRLLRKIGEGGMGVVYQAEQTAPVVRPVAFKIIKLGMDTVQVVARFEAERQALALMDHPNIARVLDAGATETGRPYFVMELVEGMPMTEYCDRNRLGTRDRLELFVKVCEAIQHAHQKGIIHRDIKPSNVLVMRRDGSAAAGIPKVIDFGVAKAINQRLTEKTLFTNHAQVIGTPAYMSPEQAEMSGLDIDTRSDIYSLGVLLYELLTGTTPLDARDLLSRGYVEMQRMITQVEPVKPSTRMSTLSDEERRVVARNRGAEADGLRRVLEGDLDWIVMKCLEKDRRRRYETSNGLAADLRRHLNHELVTARPPTTGYRLQKLFRRNKAAFLAGSAIITSLVVGIAASAWQAIRARDAEREARDRAYAESVAREQAVVTGQSLEGANRRLAETVRALELRIAEDLFDSGEASAAMAHLAEIIRRDPYNGLAAQRLVSALVHRPVALPALPILRHPASVNTAVFSPDGSVLLTGASDGMARMWDARTGIVRGRPMPHAQAIAFARFSPGGREIVTASADGILRIWNSANGDPVTPEIPAGGALTCLAFNASGDRILAGVEGRGAILWEVPSGRPLASFGASNATVTAVSFAPGGRVAALGAQDGEVGLWDLKQGICEQRFPGHSDQVTSVQFSPDGQRLLSASYDHTARLWDIAGSPRPPVEPLLLSNLVHGAFFSPDGERFVTLCENGEVQLWKTRTGSPSGTPARHEGGVRSAAFSPDGRLLVTGSMDLTARVWEVATGTAACQPLCHGELVRSVAFSPDGSRVLTASVDGTARLWHVRSRKLGPRAVAHGDRLWAIEISPDGRAFATVSSDRTARVWRISDGTPLLPPLNHEGPVSAVAFSPDMKYLATGDSSQAQIWDLRTGASLLSDRPRHEKPLTWVQFSPDGRRLVTASLDGTARVWDAASGHPITPPLVHAREVYWADMSPDGTLVATASWDHTGRLWDARTGAPIGPPLVHQDEVKCVHFHPAGNRLVTASTDNHARIWEVPSGRLLVDPLPHSRIVERAVFSPDGSRIVTASIDRTARIWDSGTGKSLTPPLRHADFVSDARFNGEGSRVVTSCLDSSVRFWDVRTGRPISERLSSGLTPTLNHVRFSADGRHAVAASNGSRVVLVWDLPEAPVPVPEWFPRLVEEFLGLRIGPQGGVEALPDPDVARRVGEIPADSRPAFYRRVAQWLVADPGNRTESPFEDEAAPPSGP